MEAELLKIDFELIKIPWNFDFWIKSARLDKAWKNLKISKWKNSTFKGCAYLVALTTVSYPRQRIQCCEDK